MEVDELKEHTHQIVRHRQMW